MVVWNCLDRQLVKIQKFSLYITITERHNSMIFEAPLPKLKTKLEIVKVRVLKTKNAY